MKMNSIELVLNEITKGLLVEKEGPFSYSCLMLDIPDSVTKNILKEIRDDDLHEEGKETEAHTTVKYGLHTQDHQEVFDFCEEYSNLPFEIILKNFSLFENEEYDVLKLEVESKELRTLNKKICDNFEFTDSFPNYNPHCTLAYLKSGMGAVYVRLLEEKFPDFNEKLTCNKLLFSEKSGKQHTKTFK